MRYARRDGAIGVIVLVWLLIGALAGCGGVNQKATKSSTTVVLLLESQSPLDDAAHRYYDRLIGQLQGDPKHVLHIQNLWGDPRTAAAAQSPDGKAAYVQLNLAGQQDAALANESVEAVRNVVARTPPPPHMHTWVIGPGQSREGEAAWERHFAGRAPGQ